MLNYNRFLISQLSQKQRIMMAPVVGSANFLDSSSQYLSIVNGSMNSTAGTFPGLDHTGNFTIEFWIKLKSGGGASQQIMRFGQTNSEGFGLSSAIPLHIFSKYRNNSGETEVRSLNFFTPGDYNQWRHIAISLEVSTQTGKFYKDTVLKSSATNGTFADSIGLTTGDFYIGANGGATYFLNAQLSDVRLWNDVRTPTEVSNNYNIRLNGNEAGLVGYWKLESDFNDSTSSSNNLTNNNEVTFVEDLPPFS